MKAKVLVITAILFFVLLHTMGLWEGYLGFIAFPAALIFAIIFLILAMILLLEIINAAMLKFASRRQNQIILLLLAVVGLTAWKPLGIINYNSFESGAVLIAEAEGVANCGSLFRLNDNGRFRYRSVCFGIQETTGEYSLSNDTVYFSESRGWDYSYAVIKRNDDSPAKIAFYRSSGDKKPFTLPIQLLKIK